MLADVKYLIRTVSRSVQEDGSCFLLQLYPKAVFSCKAFHCGSFHIYLSLTSICVQAVLKRRRGGGFPPVTDETYAQNVVSVHGRGDPAPTVCVAFTLVCPSNLILVHVQIGGRGDPSPTACVAFTFVCASNLVLVRVQIGGRGDPSPTVCVAFTLVCASNLVLVRVQIGGREDPSPTVCVAFTFVCASNLVLVHVQTLVRGDPPLR